MMSDMRSKPVKSWTPMLLIRDAVGRGIVFTLFWAALADGRFHDWPLIVITISGAVCASFALWPPNFWRWRPFGLLFFAPYFLWQSLLGGWDVARRALSPTMKIAPGIIEYELRLSRDPARVFFVWSVSLLPGTAGIGMDGSSVRIHILNTNMPSMSRLRRLEDAVASLFGERLTGDDERSPAGAPPGPP